MEKLQQTRPGAETDAESMLLAGKLKIFFGYAAGVGKTYAMLEAAHQAQKEGIDVVKKTTAHSGRRIGPQ